MHQLRKRQEARLEARLRVSESYKQLGKAAHNASISHYDNIGLGYVVQFLAAGQRSARTTTCSTFSSSSVALATRR
jgi:hypothetical protein